jgi:hypothetical protein
MLVLEGTGMEKATCAALNVFKIKSPTEYAGLKNFFGL